MHWFKVKISFGLKSDSIKLGYMTRCSAPPGTSCPIRITLLFFWQKRAHYRRAFFRHTRPLHRQPGEISFRLNEGKGNVVHDVSGERVGEVTNPEWLINDAYHWRYKAFFKSRSVAGANYNPEKKELYYFNRDSLFIYNVRSGSTDVKVFQQQCPVKLILGTNFVDARNDKLYSYETYYAPPNDNYDGPTVASLDLNTYQWIGESSGQLTSPLHHHGAYFNADTEQYTLFGGFGKMRYSKEFFSYDLNKNEWDTLGGFTGDFLSPRYFCSVGYLPQTNCVYVFGGMGNESGEQTVGRKYYYDLHKIDLNTKRVSKLWEIPWEQDNVVPVRGMVILDDSAFYTLCYPESFSESPQIIPVLVKRRQLSDSG